MNFQIESLVPRKWSLVQTTLRSVVHRKELLLVYLPSITTLKDHLSIAVIAKLKLFI